MELLEKKTENNKNKFAFLRNKVYYILWREFYIINFKEEVYDYGKERDFKGRKGKKGYNYKKRNKRGTDLFQYGDREVNESDVNEKIKSALEEQGHKESIKTMDIYVKPEENAAYYVVNKTETGKVELF